MEINARKIILALLVLLLIASGLFLYGRYAAKSTEVNQLKKEAQQVKTNSKVANFLNLFVKNVLKTDKEVSFEDRLKLENAIRDINDSDILAKWEQFTSSTTEAQIQQAVKNLLEALADKITY